MALGEVGSRARERATKERESVQREWDEWHGRGSPRGRPRRLPYPLVGGDSEAVRRGALGRALGRWNRGGRRPWGLSGLDRLADRFGQMGQMAPGEGFFYSFSFVFSFSSFIN